MCSHSIMWDLCLPAFQTMLVSSCRKHDYGWRKGVLKIGVILSMYICTYNIYIYTSGIFWNPVPEECIGIWMVKDIAGRGWGDVSVPSISSNAKPNHPGHAELCGTTLCLVDCGNKLGCACHGSNCFLKSNRAQLGDFPTEKTRNNYSIQHPKRWSWKVRFTNYLKDRSRVEQWSIVVISFVCLKSCQSFFEGDLLFDSSRNHEPINTIDALKGGHWTFEKAQKTTYESQKCHRKKTVTGYWWYCIRILLDSLFD